MKLERDEVEELAEDMDEEETDWARDDDVVLVVVVMVVVVVVVVDPVAATVDQVSL